MGSSVTRPTPCPPPTLWDEWLVPSAWNTWQPLLRDVELDGPLAPRTTGTAHLCLHSSSRGRRCRVTVTAALRPSWLQLRCALPGAALLFTLQLRTVGEHTWVTQSHTWQGAMRWWYLLRQSPSLETEVGEGLDALIALSTPASPTRLQPTPVS